MLGAVLAAVAATSPAQSSQQQGMRQRQHISLQTRDNQGNTQLPPESGHTSTLHHRDAHLRTPLLMLVPVAQRLLPLARLHHHRRLHVNQHSVAGLLVESPNLLLGIRPPLTMVRSAWACTVRTIYMACTSPAGIPVLRAPPSACGSLTSRPHCPHSPHRRHAGSRRLRLNSWLGWAAVRSGRRASRWER